MFKENLNNKNRIKKHGHISNKVEGRLYTLSFDHFGVKISKIAVSCCVIFLIL